MINKRFPKYPDDADYTTNSPSYYEDLARKQKLIELLSKRVEGVRLQLLEEFGDFKQLTTEQLDQFNNRLNTIKEEMKIFFNEWLEDGVIDEIINVTILNQKADLSFVENELGNIKDDFLNETSEIKDDFLNETNEIKDDLIQKASKQNLVKNVKDFGIIGDETDETTKLQNLINSLTTESVLYFPDPEKKYYLFSSITIPDHLHWVTLIGDSRDTTNIKFSNTIGFKIKAENVLFKKLRITGTGFYDTGSVLFNDERTSNTADFDLKVYECLLEDSETVTKTKGRGVNITGCLFFSIRKHIIDADFPDEAVFVGGSQTIQTYENGFRRFVFTNNQIHYCPCVILNNMGSNSMNLKGVQITNNVLEGSASYVKGDLADAIIKDNLHFDIGDVTNALFELNTVKNVYIDVNVNGRDANRLTGRSSFKSLIIVKDKYENLTIKGIVRNTTQHVCRFEKGGINLDIDLNATKIATEMGYNLISFYNDFVYEGVRISGIVESPNSDFIAINRWEKESQVEKYLSDLVVTGEHNVIHNLGASNGDSIVKTGRYAGTEVPQEINIGFNPKSVFIFDLLTMSVAGVKSNGSGTGSEGINISNSGFTVSGTLNTLNTVYLYIAI